MAQKSSHQGQNSSNTWALVFQCCMYLVFVSIALDDFVWKLLDEYYEYALSMEVRLSILLVLLVVFLIFGQGMNLKPQFPRVDACRQVLVD